MGLPVADPTSPDYISLDVMNALLGGSFASRITSNIREQKGYTYSPFSQIATRQHLGYWVEVADVTTAVTGPSLKEIFYEIDRLRKDPPSAQELKGIQNYLAGLFVLRNTISPDAVISQLHFVDSQSLNRSYLAEYVGKVMAVTPQDVQGVTEKYLTPGKMAVVVVGDKVEDRGSGEAIRNGDAAVVGFLPMIADGCGSEHGGRSWLTGKNRAIFPEFSRVILRRLTSRAGVAELADARDSKSRDLHWSCGFDPHLQHQ